MGKLESIVLRCKEILSEGLKYCAPEMDDNRAKIKTQINNIYILCYPKGIPNHLTMPLEKYLHEMGQSTFLDADVYFIKELERFEGFIEDLERGFISDIQDLVFVDLSDDVIQQAKELRRNNNDSLNRAACVLARIVLEKDLGILIDRNSITPSSGKASGLNDELKKKKVYSQAQWRSVQGMLDVGNAAAHPSSSPSTSPNDWSLITPPEMDKMIQDVMDFTIKYI